MLSVKISAPAYRHLLSLKLIRARKSCPFKILKPVLLSVPIQSPPVLCTLGRNTETVTVWNSHDSLGTGKWNSYSVLVPYRYRIRGAVPVPIGTVRCRYAIVPARKKPCNTLLVVACLVQYQYLYRYNLCSCWSGWVPVVHVYRRTGNGFWTFWNLLYRQCCSFAWLVWFISCSYFF